MTPSMTNIMMRTTSPAESPPALSGDERLMGWYVISIVGSAARVTPALDANVDCRVPSSYADVTFDWMAWMLSKEMVGTAPP
eukprot:CAMPEP_0181212130 /NCGR_PEP_ID=MMETSP1096-20121128/24182_1 /TAXON_ID=156174 ORGANISM="Chrysochromulina ericina, Strain CCMP281" /NCGR_SAMPLE_ID=MMETSP1096 /ASSEMBLY_ACC=CAM_ASM_000453 /LENGTH=81 /DNA_ID=CAMNT_0023303631 /DNA_START=853 /DNA_END=1094 /DNA_ORIENTATION=-